MSTSRGKGRGKAATRKQQRPEEVWRVVTHAHNAAGWWTLSPERFGTEAEAEEAAARACTEEGGCSNAGVYPEVAGVVQVPGWIKVRAVEETGT